MPPFKVSLPATAFGKSRSCVILGRTRKLAFEDKIIKLRSLDHDIRCRRMIPWRGERLPLMIWNNGTETTRHFHLGQQEFGVRSIRSGDISNPDMTRLPHTPYIKRGHQSAGEIIPVIDLRKRFSVDSGEMNRDTRSHRGDETELVF